MHLAVDVAAEQVDGDPEKIATKGIATDVVFPFDASLEGFLGEVLSFVLEGDLVGEKIG